MVDAGGVVAGADAFAGVPVEVDVFAGAVGVAVDEGVFAGTPEPVAVDDAPDAVVFFAGSAVDEPDEVVDPVFGTDAGATGALPAAAEPAPGVAVPAAAAASIEEVAGTTPAGSAEPAATTPASSL